MLMPVVTEVFANIGVTKADMGFVCSGSTDYLVGAPFSFVMALDAVGVWPPDAREPRRDGRRLGPVRGVDAAPGGRDRHRPRLQLRALVAQRSSTGSWPCSSTRITWRPCGPTPWPWPPCRPRRSSTPARPPRRTSRRWRPGAGATRSATPTPRWPRTSRADELLRDDYVVAPLRRHALPPITDGVAAVVLAAGDRARDLCDRPAWITGIDHRIETHALGRP